MSEAIKSFLSDELGECSVKSGGNVAFYCPFCNHRKKKLEVNIKTQAWHCWVCHAKGRSIRILLKQIGTSDEVINSFTKKYGSPDSKKYLPKDEVKEVIKLPKEFIPLRQKSKSRAWKHCYNYLTQDRGITPFDIYKYNIGFCETGQYQDMIIFPNYDSTGRLNYFTTRTFRKNLSLGFINPNYSRDVIGFELQLNWNVPLILVESALDAITVKINASPLYGTTLSRSLKKGILENDVSDIYLCLDPDAFSQSLKIAKYFIDHGINVYFVSIPDGEDVNSLGHTEIWKLINSTPKLTENVLLEYKIRDILWK